MGGTISVVYREKEDKTYNMLRWTNVLPSFCQSFDLYSNNLTEFSRHFLHSWEIMKQDYEKNHDSKKFEHNMTDAYFPWDHAAPSGYGILVIDALNKTIMHSQGYSNFGTVSFYNVGELVQNKNITELLSEYNDYKISKPSFVSPDDVGEMQGLENFENLFDNKFINGMTFLFMKDEKVTKIKASFEKLGLHDFKSFLEFFSDNSPDTVPYELNGQLMTLNKRHASMSIDPVLTGWTIKKYNEDLNGLLNLREEMSSLGFVFSVEDNKVWLDFIKDQYFHDESDEELKELKDLQDKWLSSGRKMLPK